jgi:hypothetical protein
MEERDFGFVGNYYQKWGTSVLSEDAEITFLWVELDAELSKSFLVGMKEAVVDDEAVCAILH